MIVEEDGDFENGMEIRRVGFDRVRSTKSSVGGALLAETFVKAG